MLTPAAQDELKALYDRGTNAESKLGHLALVLAWCHAQIDQLPELTKEVVYGGAATMLLEIRKMEEHFREIRDAGGMQ